MPSGMHEGLEQVFVFDGEDDPRRRKLLDGLEVLGESVERVLRLMVGLPMRAGAEAYALGVVVEGGPARGGQATLELAPAGSRAQSFEARENALSARERELCDAWSRLAASPSPVDKRWLH